MCGDHTARLSRQASAWPIFTPHGPRPDVRDRYPLAAAADAHRDLEARRTGGQIVLLP
jgi:hypothetical protein